MAERRRRADEVERALVQAAVDELTDRGYQGLTMDGVATRAGTNKPAIYRRWPNKTALAMAAYRHLVARPQDPPDTGELRTDVLALLHSTVARMTTAANLDVLRGLITDARADPASLAAFRIELLGGEPGVMLTIMAKAVARGEARPEAMHPRVATIPIALIRDECTIAGPESITDRTITEIVDLVFLPLVSA